MNVHYLKKALAELEGPGGVPRAQVYALLAIAEALRSSESTMQQAEPQDDMKGTSVDLAWGVHNQPPLPALQQEPARGRMSEVLADLVPMVTWGADLNTPDEIAAAEKYNAGRAAVLQAMREYEQLYPSQVLVWLNRERLAELQEAWVHIKDREVLDTLGDLLREKDGRLSVIDQALEVQ